MSTLVLRLSQLVLAAAAVAVVLMLAVAPGGAQSERKTPSGLLKSVSPKRDQPVKITAATLEVRDKSKTATFSGNVHVVQGETDVRCNVLVVYYDDQRGKGGARAVDTARGNQQIRRMEARGSVVVAQKDQRAVGERADFDMQTNTLTLSGNVVVTNAENTLRGERLVVDLTTGVTRMEASGGRVEGIFSAKSPPRTGKQN
ncbi:MAG: LPS ABC transporter substrate-binding protein LptA [Hyphomicrobiales bacterium]|nr:LPS ABC transporter substrate-binding protein LptA [Hyphomicrobiales bacterium]